MDDICRKWFSTLKSKLYTTNTMKRLGCLFQTAWVKDWTKWIETNFTHTIWTSKQPLNMDAFRMTTGCRWALCRYFKVFIPTGPSKCPCYCNPQHSSHLFLPKQCLSNWKIQTLPGQRLEPEREHDCQLTPWQVFRSIVSTSFVLAEKYSFEFYCEFHICCKSRKIHILFLLESFHRLYELIGRKWCIGKIDCIQGCIHSKRFLCQARFLGYLRQSISTIFLYYLETFQTKTLFLIFFHWCMYNNHLIDLILIIT